jgi:DNA mismatch endonuclease, patch repair protein
MVDWLSREQRSYNMASIRSKGNKTTEKAFAQLLRKARVTGWRRHVNLPGKPDFVFRSRKVALFIDGCFWHACPRCYRLPEDNRPYWKMKMLRNRRRDRKTSRLLRADGWRVLRFWEHSLAGERGRKIILAKVKSAIEQAPREARQQGQKANR